MSIVHDWSIAFAITVAVEAPLVFFAAGRIERRRARRIAAMALANIASHPAVWFIFPAFGLGWLPTTAISELWACAVEACLYLLVFPGHRRAVVTLTLVANAASFGTGLALWALGLWP